MQRMEMGEDLEGKEEVVHFGTKRLISFGRFPPRGGGEAEKNFWKQWGSEVDAPSYLLIMVPAPYQSYS